MCMQDVRVGGPQQAAVQMSSPSGRLMVAAMAVQVWRSNSNMRFSKHVLLAACGSVAAWQRGSAL